MLARSRRTIDLYPATCRDAYRGSADMSAPAYCGSCSSSDSVRRRAALCAGMSTRSCDVMALPAVDDTDGLALTPRNGPGASELNVRAEQEGVGQLAPQPAGQPSRFVTVDGPA